MYTCEFPKASGEPCGAVQALVAIVQVACVGHERSTPPPFPLFRFSELVPRSGVTAPHRPCTLVSTKGSVCPCGLVKTPAAVQLRAVGSQARASTSV
jgi:hypothetical protein